MTSELASGQQRSVKLTDPRALRAVAHPIRLELIGLLRRSGPLTATEAAKQIGESPSSCSFHLRQLEKYGLVEEAGGGHGRQRPWRATAAYTEWSNSAELGEEHHEASEMLSRVAIQRYFQQATAWFDRRRSEPPEWVETNDFSDSVLYLTPEELRKLDAELDDLLEPFIERLGDPAKRPDGARAINFIRFFFPEPDPEK
jgi:DNA-binding transcriptional ArsR family regulator